MTSGIADSAKLALPEPRFFSLLRGRSAVLLGAGGRLYASDARHRRLITRIMLLGRAAFLMSFYPRKELVALSFFAWRPFFTRFYHGNAELKLARCDTGVILF